MDSIDIYRNSSIIKLRKVPIKICSWVTILIISSILFIIWAISFEYSKYITYEAYVVGNYVEFYADKKFFERDKKQKVIIDDKEYQYDLVAVDEYSYNLGEVEYWKVVLKVKLPEELMIEKNRFSLKFLDKKTTFWKNITEKIKKGMEQ